MWASSTPLSASRGAPKTRPARAVRPASERRHPRLPPETSTCNDGCHDRPRTAAIARQAAPAAMPPGLRHSDDTRPGYTRRREEGGFAYFDVSGKRIDDAREIARIDALAIP